MPVQPTRIAASTTMILWLCIASLLWYASFLLSPSHIGSPFAYGLLLLAESIGMTQLLGIWITILFAHRSSVPGADVLHARALLAETRDPPSVAVFVTTAGEPLSTIHTTVTAARDMVLPHRTIILDDGWSDAVRSLAEELGVEYLRRSERDGKKAGNVNNGLAHVSSEFVALFDYDHVPALEFLLETLPYLLAQPQLAFVQTPQFYANTTSFIAGGDAEMQEILYRYVQVGRNVFNAAIHVGTNALFRRAALDDIGGFYASSNSEDIWTSLLLHERKWESFFLPMVLAIGTAPETLGAYFRQQFRWARGGLEVLFRHNLLLQKDLTLDQKIQYLHASMHYLSSISVLLFFLMPLLYVYFGIRPLESPEGAFVWFIHFLPYYASIFFATTQLLGRLPRWRTFVVATTTFPAHLTALLSVLTGLNLRWSGTGVIRLQRDYVTAIAPQLLLLFLSVGAIPLCFVLDWGNPPVNFMMAVWLTFNTSLLLSICRRAFPTSERKILPALVTAPS